MSPKKRKVDNVSSISSKQPKITSAFKARKKRSLSPEEEEKRRKRFANRFGGMTEEELCLRGLSDHLRPDLDVVFVGANPGLSAAFTGRYYGGPGNHFWTSLHLSGFLPHPMGPEDDGRLMDLVGIGFTDLCPRATKGAADLGKEEIKEGVKVLREKLARYKPKVAVFNGKSVYEAFSGSKRFLFGRQPEPLRDEEGGSWLWVMPSSSARCAQLPRAADKVPFFAALKKFVDFLKGVSEEEPEEEEVVFANVVLKNWNKKKMMMIKKEPVEEAD